MANAEVSYTIHERNQRMYGEATFQCRQNGPLASFSLCRSFAAARLHCRLKRLSTHRLTTSEH